MNIETIAVHGGRSVDPATGAITPPIQMSTTFERGPTAPTPKGSSTGGPTTRLAAFSRTA